MTSRLALPGLALVAAVALTLPAHAAPPGTGPATGADGAPGGGAGHGGGRFQRLDTAGGRALDPPQVLQRDEVVDALVQLEGDPVAVQQAGSPTGFDRRRARARVARAQDAALPRLRAAGATVGGRLDTVLNAVQVRARTRDLAAIAEVPGVRAVQPSRIVTLDDAPGARFTGVDRTWQDLRLTGRGQVVGVVDSGIDYTHADFGGPGTAAAYADNDPTVVERGTFPTAKVTGGRDLVGDAFDASSSDEGTSTPRPDADPLDCAGHGHGTHVAGTAAGAGVRTDGTTYRGPYTAAALKQPFAVAPGAAPQATLRSYKVFGCGGTTRDDIIAAAIDRAVADRVDVVNLSISTAYGTKDDLQTQAVAAATKAGVLVVAAAGNSGAGAYLVGSPATADSALAVAAVDAEVDPTSGAHSPGYGTTPDFSANGPRRLDNAQKPDLAAPGVAVSSAAVGTGTCSSLLSGTSMAAPHTAGIAALVRQARPSWTPVQVKAALTSTATTTGLRGYDAQRLGTGVVQPLRAATTQAYAWTSSGLNSISFGMNQLSGARTESQSFKITNRSKASVSYTFSTTYSSGRLGADVTVSPRTLTVKAGATGTATVKLAFSRADVVKLPGADRSDHGRLTALRGVVTAKPKKSPAGILPLRVAFVSVPVPLSSVKPATTVTPTSGGRHSPIKVTNSGVHSGTADVYQWLLGDPAGDATTRETADLTAVGVQVLPSPDGVPEDRLLVFAATQARGTSTQGTHEIDLEIDTDGDGQSDFITYAADHGQTTAQLPDGTVSAVTVPGRSQPAVSMWQASAPANGSTVLLPVLASTLGLTPASPPIRVRATGFSLTGDGGWDPVGGTGRFQPFSPALSQGDHVSLAPGASASIPTKVDAAQLSRQTSTGWLVVSPDDAAGAAEGDRVTLQRPAKTVADAVAAGR